MILFFRLSHFHHHHHIQPQLLDPSVLTPKKKMIAAEARTLTGQCGIDDQLMIRNGVIVVLRI